MDDNKEDRSILNIVEDKATEIINSLETLPLKNIDGAYDSIVDKILDESDILTESDKDIVKSLSLKEVLEKVKDQTGIYLVDSTPVGDSLNSALHTVHTVCRCISDSLTTIASIVEMIVADEFKDGTITCVRIDDAIGDIRSQCVDNFDAYIDYIRLVDGLNGKIDTTLVELWDSGVFAIDDQDEFKIINALFDIENIEDKVYSIIKL